MPGDIKGRTFEHLTVPWRSRGTSRGPGGGPGPPCPECGVSMYVELAGGPSDDAYRPNIDKRAVPDGKVGVVDIVHDLRNGIPLHDSHAQRLKMIDVFNYFTQDEARVLLKECLRVLRPGGSFFLRVVDLPFVCQRIVEDGAIQPWLEALYHSPDTADGPNGEGFHKWGFSFESLREEMVAAGFERVTHHGFYNRQEAKVEAWKPA